MINYSFMATMGYTTCTYGTFLIVGLQLISNTGAVCTWPSEFASSVWLDSRRGTMTFGTSTMTGWGFTMSGSSVVIDNWDCYLTSTVSSSVSRIIIKARTGVSQFSVTYIAFVCLEMTKVTDYSYYYYQLANEEFLVNYDRIRMYSDTTLATFDPTETDLCSPTDGPAASEYHVTVKNSHSSAAVVSCHANFYGSYHYSISDGTTTYCNQGNEDWNVCATRMSMVFNYSLCSTKVAYSTSGIVNCVASVTSGSYVLQTVLNTDVVLTSDDQRFTCFMSSIDGSGNLAVSQAPGSCTKTQTPTSQPVMANGTVTGYTLSLVPNTNGLCPITTTTTSTTTTTTSTTTTTPTTTTTTPTTTTTTPTTTTTTPTTTTTTPTTTTTTPTTTTTTPTTTTTTPTTTTTTPTTTTTTPTTTTTTTTTTPAPTTTTLAPTTTTDDPLKPFVVVALVIGCVIVILIIALIVIVLVLRFYKKKPKPRPETPDIIIESLPHQTYGRAGDLRELGRAPRQTTALEELEEQKDIFIFPGAKSQNFTLTVPNSALNPSRSMPFKRSIGVTGHSHNDIIPTFGDVKSLSTRRSSKQTDVSYSDSIIMDENINFALRYDPMMIAVKKEWDKSRSHSSGNNNGNHGNATQTTIRQLAVGNLNASISEDIDRGHSSKLNVTSISQEPNRKQQKLYSPGRPVSKHQLFTGIARHDVDDLASDATSPRSVNSSVKSVTNSSTRDIQVTPLPESDISLPVSINQSHENFEPTKTETDGRVQRTSTPVSRVDQQMESELQAFTSTAVSGRAPEATTMSLK